MTDSQSRLGSFTVVMVGIVLVIAGLGALGIWLVAAGEDSFGWAVGGAIAMVIFLATGIVVLVLAFRRRGGLLREKPTADDIETYREDYRE